MEHGQQLTEREKENITVYRDENMSLRWIAKKLERSYTVVHNFCLEIENYGNKFGDERAPKLTARDRRVLISSATKGKSSSKQLKETLNINASSRTIRQELQRCDFLQYQKRIQSPKLSGLHKAKRL